MGGRRWAKFAKVLARRGFKVHVICAEAHPGSPVSAWMADASTPGITIHPLPRRYPSVINRWPLKSLGEKLAYRFWLRVLPLLGRGNYRDAALFWRDQLVQQASALISAHGIRTMISSGAPFRLLHHALAVKEQHPQLHIVSDLRDPWTWWDNYGHGSLPRKRFAEEQEIERQVMEGSDRIISPSSSVLQHIAKRYPQVASKCVRIPHAIDPDEVGQALPRHQEDRFRLIYAGTLYGAEEANIYFASVIDAFQRLEALAPARAANTRFDLYIAANDARVPIAMVREAGLQERIRFHAPIPPKEIFPRIAAADAAMVFTPPKNRDLVGTKFHELFHLRVPVIHVGEPGDISRTIEEGALGCSLRVAELAEQLPRIILGARVLPRASADHTAGLLLDAITERLVKEVLL